MAALDAIAELKRERDDTAASIEQLEADKKHAEAIVMRMTDLAASVTARSSYLESNRAEYALATAILACLR